MSEGAARPRILVTGFGPFPGAPENPTAELVRGLGREEPARIGASSIKAIVLPTDYKRSWSILRRVDAAFIPDIVVHFGLARHARSIVVERTGRKRVRADLPDAAGYAPSSGVARRSGPDALAATLPVDRILEALAKAGLSAVASDDAGGYVCNATLYRSLLTAERRGGRFVGFVHVPPEGTNGLTPERLGRAARVILATATAALPRCALAVVAAGR